MSAAEIIRIPILPMKIVNAHLIKSDAGCVLVDAGIPGSARKIARELARHGLSFNDIRLIIITHAHTDHAGSAARLRQLSGAPILAHLGDAEFYSRKKPMTFCPTSWIGRLFLRTPFPHEPYEGFEPDIMIKNGDSMSLLDFGVDGLVRHTAGHTPGSIAVELSSQDVLVGDLVASGILIGGIALTERAIRPPFEDNPQTVALELARMVKEGHKRFYMGHGGPLEAPEVMRHAQTLSKITQDPCAAGDCNHQFHWAASNTNDAPAEGYGLTDLAAGAEGVIAALKLRRYVLVATPWEAKWLSWSIRLQSDLLDRIPQAVMCVLPATGHLSMLESPDAVAALIAEFCHDLSNPRGR